MNNELVIFYSIIRLSYYAKIEEIDFLDLYDNYLQLQRNILVGIEDRHQLLAYYLTILHNPQKITCDMQFKLTPDSSDLVVIEFKQQLYYKYMNLLSMLVYKAKELYDVNQFYKENYSQCKNLNARNDIDNCYIYSFLNKTFIQYQDLSTNNNNLFTDIKNYQGFHIDYRDFIRINYDSTNELNSFFKEDTLQNINIDNSNFSDIFLITNY